MTSVSTAWPHRSTPERPWLLAHRGARRDATENTLEAFELALKQGADGVELDIRTTRDRKLVVFHDPDLRRMTGWHDPRRIIDVPAEALTHLELQGGGQIPTLTEVLAWAVARQTHVNIELKTDDCDVPALLHGLLDELEVLPPEFVDGHLTFSSFSARALWQLKQLRPLGNLAWLIHHGEKHFASASWFAFLGATGVHPEACLITEGRMKRWKRHHGLYIGTWTVNEPETARKLTELGVDLLISDVPAVICPAL